MVYKKQIPLEIRKVSKEVSSISDAQGCALRDAFAHANMMQLALLASDVMFATKTLAKQTSLRSNITALAASLARRANIVKRPRLYHNLGLLWGG